MTKIEEMARAIDPRAFAEDHWAAGFVFSHWQEAARQRAFDAARRACAVMDQIGEGNGG